MDKRIAVASLASLMVGFSAVAQAAVIKSGQAQPTLGAYDQYNLTTSGGPVNAPNDLWLANSGNASNGKGQTFTVPTAATMGGAATATLTAFSLYVTSATTGVGNFTITLYNSSGTSIVSEQVMNTGTNATGWITGSFTTAPVLTAATGYQVMFKNTGSGGTLAITNALSTAYSGGSACRRNNADSATVGLGGDSAFVANLTVPEPATAGILALAGGLMAMRRRRA